MDKEFLTCRRLLSTMVILSFMFNYMLRTNMSIAIVDMIANNNSNTSTIQERRFLWNEEQKNEILGCFFWGYLLTTLLGGRLSEMYGTKVVMGTSILLASLLTLLTPVSSYLHYYCLIAVRVCIGLSLGVTWPSLPPMVTKWIPTEDQSKFLSHAAASCLGTAITLPVCGFLIANLGWSSAFYATGAVGLAWSLAWFYFVYDSPGQHPRISIKEKQFLERAIAAESRLREKVDTPWRKILTSGPVWAIVVANTSVVFNTFFVVSELPSYIYLVHHFNIEENGLMSSIPYLIHYIEALVASYLADKWINNGTFRLITVRKIFCYLSLYGPGVSFLIQSFWGYNYIVSNVVFTLSFGFMGCFYAGIYSNCLDVAPAFSGTIFGIANTFGGLAGYLSTKIVAILTKEKQDFEQWRIIFWILVGVNVFGAVFHQIFASADLQSWDTTGKEETAKLNASRNRP